MLLDTNEAVVRGGEWRRLEYMIVRLELRSVDAVPSTGSTIFAVVTLGDLVGMPTRVRTNGFTLNDISGWNTLYQRWWHEHARGRCEQGFLEFLLRRLRTGDHFRLEFLPENGRMVGLMLDLNPHVRLLGRFPSDVDVLSAYFEPVMVQSD